MVKKNIEQIAREDGRYKLDAVRFVYEGLGHTAGRERSEEEPEDQPTEFRRYLDQY